MFGVFKLIYRLAQGRCKKVGFILAENYSGTVLYSFTDSLENEIRNFIIIIQIGLLATQK